MSFKEKLRKNAQEAVQYTPEFVKKVHDATGKVEDKYGPEELRRAWGYARNLFDPPVDDEAFGNPPEQDIVRPPLPAYKPHPHFLKNLGQDAPLDADLFTLLQRLNQAHRGEIQGLGPLPPPLRAEREAALGADVDPKLLRQSGFGFGETPLWRRGPSPTGVATGIATTAAMPAVGAAQTVSGLMKQFKKKGAVTRRSHMSLKEKLKKVAELDPSWPAESIVDVINRQPKKAQVTPAGEAFRAFAKEYDPTDPSPDFAPEGMSYPEEAMVSGAEGFAPHYAERYGEAAPNVARLREKIRLSRAPTASPRLKERMGKFHPAALEGLDPATLKDLGYGFWERPVWKGGWNPKQIGMAGGIGLGAGALLYWLLRKRKRQPKFAAQAPATGGFTTEGMMRNDAGQNPANQVATEKRQITTKVVGKGLTATRASGGQPPVEAAGKSVPADQKVAQAEHTPAAPAGSKSSLPKILQKGLQAAGGALSTIPGGATALPIKELAAAKPLTTASKTLSRGLRPAVAARTQVGGALKGALKGLKMGTKKVTK